MVAIRYCKSNSHVLTSNVQMWVSAVSAFVRAVSIVSELVPCNTNEHMSILSVILGRNSATLAWRESLSSCRVDNDVFGGEGVEGHAAVGIGFAGNGNDNASGGAGGCGDGVMEITGAWRAGPCAGGPCAGGPRRTARNMMPDTQ